VELIDGVWFVKLGRGASGGFVVAHDKANGYWELWGSTKHDKLRDMGRLVPMRKEIYLKHKFHLLKTIYYYKGILNL